MRLRVSLAAFVLAAGAASGTASAVSYTVTNLGVVQAGDTSVATALNDAGQVVGISRRGGDLVGSSAFIWSNGAITSLADVAGLNDVATGINASGQVVGNSSNGFAGSERAWVWSGGAATELTGLPGAVRAFAYGINDAGQVVGGSGALSSTTPVRWTGGTAQPLTPTFIPFEGVAFAIEQSGRAAGFGLNGGVPRAVLYQGGGSIVPLGDLPGGGTVSVAFALNNNLQIVGQGSAASGQRAFLWQLGGLIDLGDLDGGSDESGAFGINDAGSVVGYGNSALGRRATIWDQANGLRDLNALIASVSGWTLLQANAINASGQIVGEGMIGGEIRAFLLTPSADPGVPEPGQWALMIGGFAVTGTALRRRRAGVRASA